MQVSICCPYKQSGSLMVRTDNVLHDSSTLNSWGSDGPHSTLQTSYTLLGRGWSQCSTPLTVTKRYGDRVVLFAAFAERSLPVTFLA
ncbi:hypothetical protein SERLA73DRAFT_191658 [Serpula lacrymans var. lacrymans S7.3]|uniref:Uncharacterized protein n=1 Tax=Serpula lacrymans var. lacrymans (strain S7.3) TaxID=936435 RepID=F8QI11_SERL3|nr:hypothetical protein SERLA73DRAFT_191658 [Serpula lacrymans var. lacrymans S7.3]